MKAIRSAGMALPIILAAALAPDLAPVGNGGGRALAQADQPTLLGQYGDLGAYTASPGGKKVCFALAKPASSKTTPPNRPRDAAYMFISSRPSEKVRDEVSIISFLRAADYRFAGRLPACFPVFF